jgi:hypothetical protein
MDSQPKRYLIYHSARALCFSNLYCLNFFFFFNKEKKRKEEEEEEEEEIYHAYIYMTHEHKAACMSLIMIHPSYIYDTF